MKTTSYKTYKCNGFTLKYYSKSYIRDGEYYGECVVAYYNGRRIVDRSTSEKRGLYDIICRLSDEERRRTTDAYIKENAARMGVAPCIVEAHIEEVQKKNSRAAVPAPKMELTAADIALYDYALGGAPVDGYTIGCADAVLKLMKKEGITPAAVDRARKKMKKQQPAPAAPVADVPAAPVVDAPAADEQPADFTPHIESNGDLHYENYTVKDDNGNAVVFGSYIPAGLLQNAPAADDAPAAPVADAPADDVPAAPVADEQPAAAPSIKNADTPSNQKKQLAAWNGAVVEILEICAADNTAVVKIKGGSRTSIPADALEPTTAKKTTLPAWMMPGAVIDVKNAVRNDAPPTRHTIESVKSTNIYYTDGTYSSINYIMHYGSPVDDAPAAPVVEAPAEPVAAHCVALAVVPVADVEPAPALAASRSAADIEAELSAAVIRCYYSSMQAQAAPLPPVDAYDVETLTANAVIIRCRRRGRSVLVAVSGSEGINNFSYSAVCLETGSTLAHGCRCGADGGYNKIEAMQAGINAAIKQYFDAADVVADADTQAEQLPEPPDVVTVSAPYPPAPRRRRFAPRLRPVLRRLGRVAAVVLPLLIVALFIGASTDSTASAPAADASEPVAQVVELPAVTVTAAAVTDAPATPSPVKKLAAPSPVKKAAADAVTLPGQKTASALATATAPAADNADSLTTAPAANGLQPTPPDGLTICAGTAWAYTMMNWA